MLSTVILSAVSLNVVVLIVVMLNVVQPVENLFEEIVGFRKQENIVCVCVCVMRDKERKRGCVF